jgi:ferredoxin
MSSLPAPSATTTADFLAEAGPRLSSLCTACGACFRACPMAEFVGLVGTDGAAVTADMRRLARGEAAALPETVRWVGACAKSGRCVSVCPEKDRGLDAMLLVRIARQQAITTTQQITPKADPAAFPRAKAFGRLQLTDEEQDRWL